MRVLLPLSAAVMPMLELFDKHVKSRVSRSPGEEEKQEPINSLNSWDGNGYLRQIYSDLL